MTLVQLNKLLTTERLAEAVEYACSRGALHHKKMDGGEGTIRRVCLHINDDGTSYIALHGELFEGAEHEPEKPNT